jgi:hypothetical protein
MKTKILLLTALMTLGSMITISIVKAQNTKSIAVAYTPSKSRIDVMHPLNYVTSGYKANSKLMELESTITNCAEKLKQVVKFRPSTHLENNVVADPEVSLDSLTNKLSKEVKFKPEDYIFEE